MEQRRTLTKLIDVQLAPFENWTKQPFTPELFNACKDFKPGDIIKSFIYKEHSGPSFLSTDDGDVRSYSPVVVVERKVVETDEEYFARMKQEETLKKQTDERERLEFLRLKAKFEPES
jgi:hypothetical protein